MALNFLLKRSGTASKRPVAASMALGELDLNYDATTGGVYYKDSSGNVVKVGPCQVSSTAPNATPAGSAGNSAGEFWYDTADSELKLWDGSAWVSATPVAAGVTGVTGTSPVSVDNTDPQNPVVSVDSASTTAPGVVQLNDTTTSTSTTQALTANQGYNLQQQIDALVVTSNLTLAGTFNADTGLVDSVTIAGTAAGFVVGSALPTPGTSNEDYFVIVDVTGITGPSGTPPYHVGDWFLSDGTTWNFLNVGYQPPSATTTQEGVVQLATDAEVQAGVNTDHAVTSSGLQSKVSDSTSTTSSNTLASSTAVKAAYDAGVQGQTDAAAAQLDADQALLDAAAAQSDASQALLDAAAAQADADQALLDAAAAQADADQALIDAAAAAAAAATAGTEVGELSTLTTTDKSSAVAAINEVNSTASAAQVDADQALLDASAAQGDATQALSDASSAQATADAALPKAGGTMTGVITFEATQTFPGTVGDLDFQAKGDLVAGYGANTFGIQAIGTDGQVLTADSTCASGMKWAANSGGMPTTGGTFTGDVTFYGGVVGGTIIDLGNFTIGDGYSENSGYSGILTGGTGTGATGMALSDNNGIITSITLNDGGSGYTVGDVLSISMFTTGNPVTAEVITVTPSTPGAGIIDCSGSLGTPGQVLTSTSFGTIRWNTPSGTPATPTSKGVLYGCSEGNNVSVGRYALTSLTSGSSNTALGCEAMYSMADGSDNVAIGLGSLVFSSSGSQNTAVGTGSMYYTNGGSCNVAVGQRALCSNDTGNLNVSVGNEAGCDITTGSNNVALGPGVQVSAGSGSCQLAIGFSATDNWLTGTSTKAIKPGAGIIDCAGSCGTVGQVLMSNGSNAVCWGTAGGGSSPTALYSGSCTYTSGSGYMVMGEWPYGTAAPAPAALSANIYVSVCDSSGLIVDWANFSVNASAPLPGSQGLYVAYLASRACTSSTWSINGMGYPNPDNVQVCWITGTSGTYTYNLAITQYGGCTAFTVCNPI